MHDVVPLPISLGEPLGLDMLREFSTGLDHPEGIAVATDGAVYAGGERGQIYRLVEGGPAVEIASIPGFALGIAVDGRDRIYVADRTGRTVWRLEELRDGHIHLRKFVTASLGLPNWLAFDAATTMYLTDSGDWGGSTGVVQRVRPDGSLDRPFATGLAFPNGCAIDLERQGLWVLESWPARLSFFSTGEPSPVSPQLVVELGGVIPDGVALLEDGSLLIACYRPDSILRWSESDGLQIVAYDPAARILAAPTNLVYLPASEVFLTPNLNRWHVTALTYPLRGVSLAYPLFDST